MAAGWPLKNQFSDPLCCWIRFKAVMKWWRWEVLEPKHSWDEQKKLPLCFDDTSVPFTLPQYREESTYRKEVCALCVCVCVRNQEPILLLKSKPAVSASRGLYLLRVFIKTSALNSKTVLLRSDKCSQHVGFTEDTFALENNVNQWRCRGVVSSQHTHCTQQALRVINKTQFPVRVSSGGGGNVPLSLIKLPSLIFCTVLISL